MNSKKILFGLILLFLTLPWLQQEFTLFSIEGMKGEFTKSPSATFTIDSWLDGTFQSVQEKYLNENFGFRNTCVRINNQIAFSLFNMARSKGVIVGKDQYLYGDGYIKAYYGDDFLGKEKISDNIRKLKFVREVLKKKNIDLIVVIVPGKATFFPEFIPDEPRHKKKTTNYSVYKRELPGSGIPFLDLCSYLTSQKTKSVYPLFPKTGIHWSVYSTEIAADTIARFIGQLRNAELPRVRIKSIKIDDNVRGTDDDIEAGLNLLFSIPKFRMAYPEVEVDMENKTRPHVLTIADSYFWGIYGSGRAAQIFNTPHFWYYYSELYVPEKEAVMNRSLVDLKKEIEQQDVIMLLSNDARTLDLGSGFIDDAYDLYANGGRNLPNVIAAMKAKEEGVKLKMGQIKADKKWFESLLKVAEDQHLNIDTVLKRNAIYMYDKEHPL